mmetsp:Transcript_21919/g.70970  ORF Transcript_21919/g.70970 Transcript_21919/m.70970 type:complete len:249 (-) Transcript_21919:114-860(-)
MGLLRRLGVGVHLVHARGVGLPCGLGSGLHHINARGVGLLRRLGVGGHLVHALGVGILCGLGSGLHHINARGVGLLRRLGVGGHLVHALGVGILCGLGSGLHHIHAPGLSLLLLRGRGISLVLLVGGRLGVVQGLLAHKRGDYVQTFLQVLRESLLWCQRGGNMLSHTLHFDLFRQIVPDDLLYRRLGNTDARLHAGHALLEAGDAGVRLRLHTPPLAAQVGDGPKRRHAEHRQRRAPLRCGGGCARC